MRVVVADTSPINYLILIGCIDVLPILYGRVVIPEEVFAELTATGTPPVVASWIHNRPDWIEVRPTPPDSSPSTITDANLDAGEIAAIRLALAESNCLLLIDESAGRAFACRLGIPNTGTLGILLEASTDGLVDLRSALDKLQRTNFRVSQALINALLLGSRPPNP
jgi:predicted nucleic acid-binding protein